MTIRLSGYAAKRLRIYQRDAGICGRCGLPAAWDDWDLGHIVDRFYGGSNEDSNLRVEHKSCNRRAGQRLRQPGVSALPAAREPRW